MGGGVHIDFNLDFLSADPTSNSAKRTLFGHSRAALPGAMPTWYARFRQYATYEVGHIVVYYEDSEDLLVRDQRSNISATNLYVCVDSRNAGNFNPTSSASWQSLASLESTHHVGFRAITRTAFLAGDNAIEDNQICLNLFEFVATSFIICNSTFTPKSSGLQPISLKPRVGASFGGGVTRTRRELDLDESNGGNLERFTVDYPQVAISGNDPKPLPSRKFGYAANSLNAQLGSEIEAIDPKNDPLDPDINRISFNLSEIYQVGDVVNYYPLKSGTTSSGEDFDTTNHPKIAVCVKPITSPARNKSTGDITEDKTPWNSSSTYWEEYSSASNRPNSSLSSVYDYLVNKKNKFPGFTVNTSQAYNNLSGQPVLRGKPRISMNDFGGTSNIYGHFLVHWATALRAYNRSDCRTWYSGGSSQSGPYQDGQYDVFIYTKSLKKDHGGQPRLAVTFGKTTAIKFLSVSGVSTFSTGVIDSNKINQYLKDKNFNSNNISTVSSEADIIHYQYNNLVPSYFMRRGYVHARRRGGVHPGSNKGDRNLGKYILFIEDLLSRQRIEMVTPQIFSNGNPRTGLHGASMPYQDWGETGATRNYQYTKSITDGNLTELLSTKTSASTAVQPMHYLILGNALSSKDQISNKGKSFTNRFVDRAFRPIFLRTDALSQDRFDHILGLMQTGFSGVDASKFKNLVNSESQNIDEISDISNKIWMDLGETFHKEGANPLFKSMSSNIGAFKTSTLVNLNSLPTWESSTAFKPQQITRIKHSDYWEIVSSGSGASIWYHDETYQVNDVLYLWSDGKKKYYKCIKSSKGISPKESSTFFRAIYANTNKEPIFHNELDSSDRFWTKIEITRSNIGNLKGFVSTLNPYTSLRILASSDNWPTSGRKAARIGFGWKRTFSEEGILNQITENNQEISLQVWSEGADYQEGDIVTVQSGPIKALGPDGNYYTYEEWVRLFDVVDSEQEEVSLIFSEAEAANSLFAFKCLKDTSLVDLDDPASYAGLIPGFIPSDLGVVSYNFIPNIESEQVFNTLVSENIMSQTTWIDLSTSQWSGGQIDSLDYERYGMNSENINKRDVFGAGTNNYDLSFEPYYKIGDAVVMRVAGTDFYKLKVKAFHLIKDIPPSYTNGGLINSSTEIKPKNQNYFYQYNIDLSSSNASNYDSSSSFHNLIRSQWWQPIAKRNGSLNKNYPDALGNQSFYYVVPRSFDYIHLEEGLSLQTKTSAMRSVIKIYFDEVRTFDLRGSAYYWNSDVKNVTSNMINALPASGTETDLEDRLIAEFEHPYVDFNTFNGWTDGSGQSPHPLTLEDTDSHEAVKYFKNWLYSNFEVDLARDFNDGSAGGLDARLSDKFDLINYYSFYSPTVTLKYHIYDESGSAIGTEQDYVEGSEIEIEKGQRIKITPSLERDSGTSISPFSFICNSFAKNNVLGLFLRTPVRNSQKNVDFNYTFSSTAISEPPVDGDGVRIPFFTEAEATSGLPDITDGELYDLAKDLNKEYSYGDRVLYEGNIYIYKVSDNASWEADTNVVNNPMISVGRWKLSSWRNPVTNRTDELAPIGTKYRDDFVNDIVFKTSTDEAAASGSSFDPVFSSSAFVQDTNLTSVLFQGNMALGGNDQLSDLQGEISQSYEEVSIKETLLSRFKKNQSLHDQYGVDGSAENDLLKSPPKWRNINGPEGQIVENEIVGIDWSVSGVYAEGEIVSHENKYYISTEINSGINPSTEPKQWRIVQPWHLSHHYYEGDHVYIYENTLSLGVDGSGNPLEINKDNINLYGPGKPDSNGQTLYPSWSKVKRYEVGELVSKGDKIYRCTDKDFAQTELRFNQIFTVYGNLPAAPNYGGKFAFYVCDKNVEPGGAGHNPRRLNILTSLHGDDEILIRPSDNISKTFTNNDEVYIDFDYQNGNAFEESTKNITLSLFGYHVSIDDRKFLDQVQLYPDLAESHPQLLSAWSLDSSGEGLTSTGILNIKVRVKNPNPTTVIERDFEPATPALDSTCQTFVSSTPSMIYQNKFLINNGKLYASGLDSSEFGFIGLMDNTEFQDYVSDSFSEGSQSRSYNKLWSFENISVNPDNARVKIYQNGSTTNEIANKDKISMVQSEGGNTVFICDGELYGVGHNQGYSLGLCADPQSTFGIGSRADSLTLEQKKSEALQDLMEVFLHFDSEYYLKLQSRRTGEADKPYNYIGDNAVKFGTDQDENLMAWIYFLKRGFYQSINSEWEAIGYKATSGEIWNGAVSGINYLKDDWTFTSQYSDKWISDPGAVEGTVQYLPHYAPSDFWQSGGVHAYNLNKSNDSAAWGVMNIGDLDSYMEVSIFEKMKKAWGDVNLLSSFSDNLAQVKWKENPGSVYHGTIDYTEGGAQPRLGWNGILLSYAAVNDRYTITQEMLDTQWWSQFKVGRTIPVAGEDHALYAAIDGLENGDIQAEKSDAPKRSFYNNIYIYPSDPSTGYNNEFAPGWDNLTPGQALYIDGKPFWNPVLGNPDHILLDWAAGEYAKPISGNNHWLMGLYKLKSQKNITWGNYPRFSKFENYNSIAGNLGYPTGEKPGGERFVDGLSGTNKQVIPARTYAPYATKLVDEDVTWAATNKYSTFYINANGEVKALGSICACPAYKVQGFDIPEDPNLTSGGKITSTEDIVINNYDNFGSLNLEASWNNDGRFGFPIVSNNSWALIKSEAGNKPSTNLAVFMPEFFGDEDIFFGQDRSLYNYKDVNTEELIVSGPESNHNHEQDIVNVHFVGDFRVHWNEVRVQVETTANSFYTFNWWTSTFNNENVVKAGYRMILNREVDTGDDGNGGGLAYYKSLNLTFYELTRMLLGSTEYKDNPQHDESPIPLGTEKMMAMFNHYGNTAPLLSNGAHSIRMGRFKGAFIMEGCEREEVNGVYLPSLPQNDDLPNSFGLASSEWYYHAHNPNRGTEYNIYESMHDTPYGKILVYWDPGLKLWRMQYSSFWEEDDTGDGYRIQMLVGMQQHHADANFHDGTGYYKNSKSNLKTPADVGKWHIGHGDWKNNQEGDEDEEPTVPQTITNTQHQYYDSTRISWPARRFFGKHNWNTTQHPHLTILPLPIEVTSDNIPTYTADMDSHSILFTDDGTSQFMHPTTESTFSIIPRDYTFSNWAARTSLGVVDWLEDVIDLAENGDDDGVRYKVNASSDAYKPNAVARDFSGFTDITINTNNSGTRKWIPPHWGDQWDLSTDYSGEKPRFTGDGMDWDTIPENVDFVTQFSNADIASGALGHYRGGAVREAFSMFSPFDTVPQNQRDSLDVWRYSNEIDAVSMTFKIKFSKETGAFDSTGVAFGFYVFTDMGVKTYRMSDVDGLFNLSKIKTRANFYNIDRRLRFNGGAGYNAFVSELQFMSPAGGFVGGGELPILQTGMTLETSDLSDTVEVKKGWWSYNASGTFSPPGGLQWLASQEMPADYVENGEFEFISGQRFYYFDYNLGIDWRDESDITKGNWGYHFDIEDYALYGGKELRLMAYFQRFFRWDNYCWRVFDSDGNLKHDMSGNGDVPSNKGITGSSESWSSSNWAEIINHIIGRSHENRTIGWGTVGHGSGHWIDYYPADPMGSGTILPYAPGADIPNVEAQPGGIRLGPDGINSQQSRNLGSYADFNQNELTMELTINAEMFGEQFIEAKDFYVVAAAEHLDSVSDADLALLNEGYEISVSITPYVPIYTDPMFLSEVETNLVNFQNVTTNEPEYAGPGHPFEHDTGNFNENPLVYKFQGDESEIYDWHGSLTDWNYYLDSQPGLEIAIRQGHQLSSASKADVGFIHWNMPLTAADRSNRSKYIQTTVSQRLVSNASYFRGIQSMRHNTNWFYDDLLGWVTRDIDSHSPDNNSISNPYSSSESEWMFSAKYGNWFSINQENKDERHEGRDFVVKFANHNFDFIEYISGEQEFNNKDSNFTKFSIVDGVPTAGYIPNQSGRYTQFDSYSYDYGDIVKIELAEGEDHYRTLYFMSKKDGNRADLGFNDSLSQDETKEFNIPAPKGLTKRYAVESNTSSDGTDLSGAIKIYDPEDYGGDKATRISMGESHAIILTEAGRVYGVGDNSKKQIDKYFERDDQFYNLSQDTNFGTRGSYGYEYLERTTAGNSDPNESMSGWKVVSKPLFAIKQWSSKASYSIGDRVFIKKETATAILSNNLEFDELWKSAHYTNHPGDNPNFVNTEKQAKRAQKHLFTEFICENSIGNLFNRSWVNGNGKLQKNKNSRVIFSGIISGIFKHKSLKNYYREARGDARFLTQECYLRPHRIDNFSKQGVAQSDVLIKNIKCSGYGSLFLDSANNLYGIGNNEISKSKRSDAFSEHRIGTVFGISSNFLEGPEFLKESVSFMHKNGDFVSYISNGYAYKAGGANLFPYFENYQNSGAEALVLNNDGTPLVSKMIFIDGSRFWDNEDWFLKRFLSQKINDKFYLMDEYYKPSYADRCSLNTRKGQYLSNVFAYPVINDFVKEWEPGKHYKEMIKDGQIMNDSDGEYVVSEREDDSTKFHSIEKFNCLPSCFESQMPSLVSYQGKIYQCLQTHGVSFGRSASDFNIDDRVGRKWWDDSHTSLIPSESPDYWKEISADYNKNMVQFLSEELRLFNLSSLSYVSGDEEFFVKGFCFGLTQSALGQTSGIEDNSELISYERGYEIADRSPESRVIFEKYWNQEYDSFVKGAQHNPYIPKWTTFIDLQGERIEGWRHPVPKTEALSNTLSGGRPLSFVDMLSLNRKKGMYWIGRDSPIDFSALSLSESDFSGFQSDLATVFENNVHSYQFDDFVQGLKSMNGWKQGVSSHFRQARPFLSDGKFGECLNLIWPAVDPFAVSIFSSYRGEYVGSSDGSSIIDNNYNPNQGLDLSSIDITANPRNYRTHIIHNEKNPFAYFDNLETDQYSNVQYNILMPAVLRVPTSGLYSWWDVIRDIGARLKDSVHFSTNSQNENPFASFSFMEHYFSDHTPSIFPAASSLSFTAKTHISESSTPWADRNNDTFFNPWGENNFIERIAKGYNWHIQDNMQTVRSTNWFNVSSRNIFTSTLIDDLTSIQTIITQTYNQSLYHDFLKSKFNTEEFVEITDAYKDLLFLNTSSHHAFFLNSYILDPASLPFNNTIPKWGYKINNGEIQQGSSYSAGDRVFHEGYPFVSLQNSNISTPVVGDLYDTPTTNSSWKYEEPMDLHRYRSQILFAHGITLSKLSLNMRHEDDPYAREAFIPQETIGHSQIDFSFVSKNTSLTNFHNFRSHNLMRRADWEQTDESGKLPYQNMENETHPLAEGEDVNADPLLSQSTNKKGYNIPSWYALRSGHWANIWNSFLENDLLPDDGGWFNPNGIVNSMNAERIIKAYGWRDGKYISKGAYSDSEVGASIDYDVDKVVHPLDNWLTMSFMADAAEGLITGRTYVPLADGDLGGFILGTPNQTEQELENMTGNSLKEQAYNAGYHGYKRAEYYLSISESELEIKNVYYKFPKPAFPSLYGNITDYMECVSELHKFGFSNFTHGQNSTHKIWGRELNHDFYCSSKLNSHLYSSNTHNALLNRMVSGQNKTFDDSNDAVTASKTEFDNSEYYFEVDSDDNVTFPTDEGTEQDTIYIRDRSTFFESDRLSSAYENNSTGAKIFSIKYKNASGSNVTEDIKILESVKVGMQKLFLNGSVYYFMQCLYYCCKNFYLSSAHTPLSERLPAPGQSNDVFKFITTINTLSPSVQQVPIYDTNFGHPETLTEVPGKKLNLFEDFPAAVKNLRHLRFEVKPIFAMQENFNGKNQVYVDTLNQTEDYPDGTEHIHQGFINHNYQEGTRQWVLEGGLAGLVLSDYFDIFKEGYSYKKNKAYRSGGSATWDGGASSDLQSSTCLAQIMSIGLGPDDDYAMTREEAKDAAEEYVIQLAKNREGLDYVWYDARLEAWVAGRNWLHENIDGASYPSESIARDAAHDNGLSDQSLISWETEYIPRPYRTNDGVQKDFDKFIAHDVIYIGGKEHHQCLARINGVIKKWEKEIELAQPGILNIENGQLFFALVGSLLHVEDWQKISGISFDIS